MAEEAEMKESTEMNGGNFSISTDTEEPGSIFLQLKPYCLGLLEFLQNPNEKSPRTLFQLAELLRRAPPAELQPFLEISALSANGSLALSLSLIYRLHVGFCFKLVVLCRAKKNAASLENFGIGINAHMPRMINDRVSEGVLQCMEEVLKKCHLGSVNQMVVVLKKLTSGALLSPSEAAEEIREGIIRCFKALLLRLNPCSNHSCTCKQSPGLPTLLSNRNLEIELSSSPQTYLEPNECLLAFLQSQNASPAVGHWLSILFQIADAEAARGLRGSAKLRVEAFLTLRVLVAKVGSADALAFFLPGTVSYFTKVLQVTKTMISGPAGTAESIDIAIRGLAEFLMIVLGDDVNISVLKMLADDATEFSQNKEIFSKDILESLRRLPFDLKGQEEGSEEGQQITNSLPKPLCDAENTGFPDDKRSLHVKRTKEWIEETTSRVDKLLSAAFPHECLCVLVYDDMEDVSVAAEELLESVFLFGEKHLSDHEVAEVFKRLVERLPRVVLASEETVAASHAQRLLAVMYYVGPQLVVDYLLSSPITAAHFMDVLMLSMSHSSVFAGSADKFILGKPTYLPSITELNAGIYSLESQTNSDAASHQVSKSVLQHLDLPNPMKVTGGYCGLPRMPPWFVHVGGTRLYQALAGILRLVGLSMIADHRSDISLSVLIDIPLENIRKLVSELRMRAYSKESWHSWYARSGSGHLLRQASTAACILNEIMYGMSDLSVNLFAEMFGKSKRKGAAAIGNNQSDISRNVIPKESVWKVHRGEGASNYVIDCAGSILHEYLSQEVWDLPTDQKSSLQAQDQGDEVIIDGIGILSISLGKDFLQSGFLHASLYLLLETLICSSYQKRSASDVALHVLATASGHSSVGHLVVANADYIIDSLCQHLRHLDLNPHVPDVLAAMLSYIGVAHEILPLLEEPKCILLMLESSQMHAVTVELEVLGRHQHPSLTIPFLKAVREIAKASKHEAGAMPSETASFLEHAKSKTTVLEQKEEKNHGKGIDSSTSCIANFSAFSHANSWDLTSFRGLPTVNQIMKSRQRVKEEESASMHSDDVDRQVKQWEGMLFKLNEAKQYRRTIGSIAGSCLTAVTPLLASVNEAPCLLALDTIQDGLNTLAKVEEAYKYEKESKEAIGQAIQFLSFRDLQDAMDVAEDAADENRLLPAMNRIWPYLIHCLKNKNLVVRSSGLVTSPFRRKPMSKEERPLLLPYRSTSLLSAEDSMSEISSMKVQEAALSMIAEISRNKRSASAFEAVLKKVSGLVVGIACSGITGLRDAALNALLGLACIDPDLIWLLLADVYYSVRKDIPPPPTEDFADIAQLLPPPSSLKEYFYRQYGGESFGFDIDDASVELAFQRLQSQF
ncbi:hypothetical protein ACLOJK_021576 [Asimina triloba]